MVLVGLAELLFMDARDIPLTSSTIEEMQMHMPRCQCLFSPPSVESLSNEITALLSLCSALDASLSSTRSR